MERFTFLSQLGAGTFGTVWKAINNQTNEEVAIKKLKKTYSDWDECLNLREIQSLRKLSHRNIVKLKEVVRENERLFVVFECMEKNLYEHMKEGSHEFSESSIRNWMHQILLGLSHMHASGYFHRDLKPENMLMKGDTVKIADFGLVREVDSKPPYTEYVSTRWYRAPEVLLQAPDYNAPIDMWAVGVIMAELFTCQPLFPGSSEIDQIVKICSIIGTPDETVWPEGVEVARASNFKFPECPGVPMSTIIPRASGHAIHLITALCSWDPLMRPTAHQALQHPFFTGEVQALPASVWGYTATPEGLRSQSHNWELAPSRCRGCCSGFGSCTCRSQYTNEGFAAESWQWPQQEVMCGPSVPSMSYEWPHYSAPELHNEQSSSWNSGTNGYDYESHLPLYGVMSSNHQQSCRSGGWKCDECRTSMLAYAPCPPAYSFSRDMYYSYAWNHA